MPPGIAEQSRVDAVLTILEESEGPLSPADIRDRLHERGRDDEYRLVSSSLDYLRRSRRAHRVGRGAWIAGPEASDDASAATQEGVDD
jgi:repressor of nif and glnA expression